MSTGSEHDQTTASPPRPPVDGVLDAYGKAWTALFNDFGNLWVATFLFWMLMLGASVLVGWIPCFGGLLVAIFVQAPLWVGWYGTLEDGLARGRADLGRLFSGFQERYWTSVLALLVPLLVLTGASLVGTVGLFGGISLTAIIAGEEEPAVIIVPMVLYGVLWVIVSLVVWTLFLFVPIAVWDHPESGWDAVTTAVKQVSQRLPQAIGYVVLLALINLVAGIVGLLACCVGLVFTIPFAQAWTGIALVLLYRSWSETPLRSSEGS